jgi:hypothetical protein
LDPHHVLRHLVPELALGSQPQRSAVGDRQHPIVELVGENCLGMECIDEVELS